MLQFLKTAILAGTAFGLAMGLFFGFQSDAQSGLVSGLIAGLFFGVLIAAFAAWQRAGFQKVEGTLDGEPLLKQGPANHFRGIQAVGGWLFLTHERLIFKPHHVDLQTYVVSIHLNDILEARACMTALLIPNGMRITTTRGIERFVVQGRRIWADEINQAKHMITSPKDSLEVSEEGGFK